LENKVSKIIVLRAIILNHILKDHI